MNNKFKENCEFIKWIHQGKIKMQWYWLLLKQRQKKKAMKKF